MVVVRCSHADCRERHEVDESRIGKSQICRNCRRAFVATELPTNTHRNPRHATEPKVSWTDVPLSGPHRIGRFEILETLGAGAFGAVYRARDPQLNREVAVKIPLPGLLISGELESRFLREAQAAARLNHPHIVPVYDAGRDGDHYYIASAFIEGQSLAEQIPALQGDFRRIADLIRKLAEALAYAHSKGIIHRDVKPQNVLMDRFGDPHVLDFGLAQVEDAAQKLTHAGAVMGTPAYMAPEQAADSPAAITPASDQFSLGVVLYELLTGETPFSGAPAVVLFNLLNRPIEPPRQRVPAIPRDLETICLKAVSKDPAERYASLKDLAEDLARWREDRPILARPIGRWEQLVRWRRRNPTVANLVLTVIAVSTLGFAATSAALIRAEAARKDADRNLAQAQQEFQRAETNLSIARTNEAKALAQAELALASEQEAQRQATIARQESARALEQSRIAANLRTSESEQRLLAEKSAAESDRQKKAATSAAESARKSQMSDTQRAYVADLRVMQQAWEDGELSRFRQAMARRETARLPDGRDPRNFEYYYWERLANACAQSLPAGVGLTSLLCLSDGKTLVAGKSAGQLIVWDLTTGVQKFQTADLPPGRLCLRECPPVTRAPVKAGEAAPSSGLLIGCSDGSVRIYETQRWDREPYRFQVIDGPILELLPVTFDPGMSNLPAYNGMAFTKDLLQTFVAVSGENCRAIQIAYRKLYGQVVPRDERLERILSPRNLDPAFVSPVRNRITAASSITVLQREVVFGREGPPRWLAMAAEHGDVLLWGYPGPLGSPPGMPSVLAPRPFYAALIGAKPPITQLHFSLDGKAIVAIDQDQNLKLWELEAAFAEKSSRVPYRELLPPGGILSGTTYTDKLFAIGKSDGSVAIHELPDQEPVEVRRLHTQPVTHLAASTQGHLVAASSNDGQIFVWRPLSEVKPLDLPIPVTERCAAGQFSPNGDALWLTQGRSVKSLNLESLDQPLRTLHDADDEVESLQLLPDGSTALIRVADGTACVIDSQQRLLRRWQGVQLAGVYGDTAHLLTADNTWRRWTRARESEQLVAQTPAGTSLQPLSSGAGIAALAGGPTTWTLWLADDRQWKSPWEITLKPSKIALESVTASLKPGVKAERVFWRKYWRGLSAPEKEYGNSQRAYRPVARAARERQLALGGLDNVVHLVDEQTGAMLQELRGHSALISAMTFNADESRLISGDIDGLIIVWDLVSGEPILQLNGLGTHTMWISASSDNRKLAAGGMGWARLWSADPVPEKPALPLK